MSWRLHHTWHWGAKLPETQIATCTHCGVLRVDLDPPKAGTAQYFLRPVREGQGSEDERVLYREPACHSGPLDRRNAQERGRLKR